MQGEHVEVVETKEYVGDPAFCTATTQLVKVGVVVMCMGVGDNQCLVIVLVNK